MMYPAQHPKTRAREQYLANVFPEELFFSNPHDPQWFRFPVRVSGELTNQALMYEHHAAIKENDVIIDR